ncbi:MAG: 2-C-methyl-D-erythritol 4-phosphate cytidylyltransferase [Alistipes sp.]|nr:2-C-methyl-D-erythritol 4-phosphate cytidylyltransferase [Alistipes sp.]
MEEIKVGVVIVAGGSGSRMGSAIPKQFALIDGEPILVKTINNFAKALPGAKIIVVLPATQIDFWKNYSARFRVARHKIVEGGEQRFHSVKNGIEAITDWVDIIAIQDGVRPFASLEMIREAVKCAVEHGSAIPVIEAVDSFREVTEDGGSKITDRTKLRVVQTPQIFEAGLIRAAYDTDFDISFTDDASVVERTTPHRVTLCRGERQNIKITTPDDMVIAEAIAKAMKEE